MNKRFVNAYVKYTTKNPFIFFGVILVGVLSIVLLALITKTGVVISVDGTIDNYAIIINEKADSYTGFIYAYSDRNERMYSIEISETIHEEGQTIFLLKGKDEFISTMNQKEIKVDIPVREMTIFERVFLKGGKVNG